MKCGACVRAVEQTLLQQTGVVNASVNLVARTAWVALQHDQEPIEPILKALSDRGFAAKLREANPLDNSDSSEINLIKGWWSQWRQLMVAISLLLLSVLGHLAEGGRLQSPILGSLPFHAGLATMALFGPGLKILVGGVKATISLAPTMDTLVALGVSSAYFASLVALVWPEVGWPCFFNEPVMLLGFVLLGRFLEERARFRTGRALNQLAKLQPEKAKLILEKGVTKEIRVGALRPGETIELLAGDRIPVDGVVLTGHSSVDVASLTGEPLPIEASPGTELASGTLNLESTLTMEVKKVGAETALAKIVNLVEQAQARKAPIQALADRVAGSFCYGVVALASLTFLFWWQLGTRLWPEVLNLPIQHSVHSHSLHSSLGTGAQTPLGLALQLSIAVLVVACPCALGLATPTVITVATGLAARHGWLFRGGDVVEKASTINQVVFDKTGTLTIGRPLVSQLICSEKQEDMLRFAASVEQNSRHPLAHAVLQETQRRNLLLLNSIESTTYPGLGIAGSLEGVEGTIRVGTPEWLKSEGVNWGLEVQRDLDQAIKVDQSLVGVSLDKKLLGFLTIEDRLRPDASIAIARLREQSISMFILSGDRRQPVQRLGKLLGFQANQLGWQLLPGQKLERLNDLRQSGPVAMVGDGINDAPALAAADLGIAVGTGTQIAQESADLVLLGDRLESVPEALLLANRAMNKIRQNLFWAFGYNLIALPIAAGVLLPGYGLLMSPPIASLLMAFSSITVVVNALTLRKA